MRGSAIVRVRFGAAGLLAIVATSFATETFAAMEDIVVSTRKREENLQSVPIAIDAISGDEIQRLGITDLQRLTQQSSSLKLDQGFSPQDLRINVRGLSPTRGRQNVAVLMDGIDVSSEAIGTAGGTLLINPRLFDLERVEIVKGPQLALYGRSAFAGAINYITKKPGDEFMADVRVDVGNYGQQEAAALVSGPITDNLSAGVTGMLWSHDGFYRNAITGGRMGDSDGTSVAGTLVFRPTEALSITARVENLNDEFGITPFVVMPFNFDFPVPQSAIDAGIVTNPSPKPGVKGPTPDGDSLVAQMSERSQSCFDPTDASTCSDWPGTERDVTRATLTIEWNLGAVDLRSLTHFADTSSLQQEGAEDVSASVSPTGNQLYFENNTDLFSQEFQVASTGDGPITWVAGALFWNEQTDFIYGSYTCLNFTDVFAGFPNGPQPCGPAMALIGVDPGSPLNPDLWTRDTEHYSIYGLVEWQFLEQWKVAFEARQTWEDVEAGGPNADRNLFDPSGNLCIFLGCTPGPQQGPGTVNGVTTVSTLRTATEDDDFFAPKVTLTWTPSDDTLIYLSWAEAFKPRGITQVTGGAGVWYDDTCGTGANPLCTDPVEPYRFDQEKLDSYELGAKTEWLDNRLTLNAALFFQDFKNKQVSTQITGSTGLLIPVVRNAGKAEVWGLELEAAWALTDNLSAGLSYTYLDTEYTQFIQFTTGSGTIAYAGNCTPFTEAGSLGCNVSYGGNELERAPAHTIVGNARYQDRLVGSTDWFLETDFRFEDDRFASEKNAMVFPSYWLFNFRAGLTSEKLDLVAYVDNAFEDTTIKTGFEDGSIPTFFQTNGFFNQGTLYAPNLRTYGVRLTYRFAGR